MKLLNVLFWRHKAIQQKSSEQKSPHHWLGTKKIFSLKIINSQNVAIWDSLCFTIRHIRNKTIISQHWRNSLRQILIISRYKKFDEDSKIIHNGIMISRFCICFSFIYIYIIWLVDLAIDESIGFNGLGISWFCRTNLESCRTPINELNGFVHFELCNWSIHILRNNITSV